MGNVSSDGDNNNKMRIFGFFGLCMASAQLAGFALAVYRRGNFPVKRLVDTDRCTTVALGREATVDGSSIATHSADCAECDWRINKVEAKDWPQGSLRPIYLLTGAYPRQVREDRGHTWSVSNLEDYPEFHSEWEQMTGPIIGYIPQVPHTYALIEGMYGIMNEFQVGIGESTCPAKFWAKPMGDAGGKALLEISELSQIGLERGKTAREVIKVMGDLAVRYGFYSAVWDSPDMGDTLGEAGEGLSVVDPDEAWAFHVLPDDTGSSAIWVAQRVPDAHISVIANMYSIRHVNPDSPDFLFSDNLWEIAEKHGWWKPADGLLDFKKVYSPERVRPNYSNLRIWRVLSMAAPSRNFPSASDPMGDDYPFSVPVDKKWSVRDVMALQRDHYQNTPFDMSKGLAGGPYGDPNRFDKAPTAELTTEEEGKGEFPRSISLFRTSYVSIAVARRHVPNLLGMLWLCQYNADSSTFTPLYVSADSMPTSWIRGAMQRYDTVSAWWNFCVVGNYAARFYNYAMKPVRELQARLEVSLLKRVQELESVIQELLQDSKDGISDSLRKSIVGMLTKFVQTNGDSISREWRDLFPRVVAAYRDGFELDTSLPSIGVNRLFYPRWWLEKVGYFDTPSNNHTGAILLQPAPGEGYSVTLSYSTYIFSLFACTALFTGVALVIGYRLGKEQRAYPNEVEMKYAPVPTMFAGAVDRNWIEMKDGKNGYQQFA